jgi:hypothetical protein
MGDFHIWSGEPNSLSVVQKPLLWPTKGCSYDEIKNNNKQEKIGETMDTVTIGRATKNTRCEF